ncbi:MAG: peptidoglycan DD-metalloendopeptidase family protein [Lachnospiraceae bacterium]|nr:peptidoglycan DD-metalloendopeptidase family protein [Lachnospiraceae bacterium]
MKNRLKIITAIMLTLIFCMQPVCNVQATEESNLSEAQQEKKTLENDLQKAKELIDSLKGSKEDIQSEVEKLDKQLNEISGKVKELESQLSKKRQEIADTESALNKAKEQEKKQYRNMKKRIQFMYENGQTSYVEMLLSADSFTDFLNAVEYITQISQYDRKMLKEYQNMQVTIADTQKTLETDYASLQSLQAKVQEEKQAVAALESAKKGELNDVADDLTDAQTVAKAYEAEIQAQNEVIAQIQAAQKRAAEQQAAQQQAQAAEENQGATDAAGENQNTAQNTTPSGNGQSTGSMMWPCPSSKRVTSDYGPRTSPTNGASSNHKGIDIGAAYGADIVAADGGTVLVATYSSSGGNYVIIDHGGGLCTVYMHASSLTVSAGQTVSKGQVIAKVGSTGISTGNHLHFGVTLNGVYVSPWGYVS